MSQLAPVSELLATPGFWPEIAASLHWEEETLRPTRSYREWMGAHAHSHNYTELVLNIAGEHSYGVAGKALKLSPGSAVLIPKRVSHDDWYSEHHAPCIDFWMHFLPHGHVSTNFVEHTPGSPLSSFRIALSDPRFPEDCKRVCQWLDEEESPSPRTKAFLSYLLQLVIEKFRIGEFSNAALYEHAIIGHMKEHILKNLTERLCLEELARVAGYSPFYFHRVFTRTEKITPRAFIETQRIKLACRLLESGHSVTSAAFDSGFSTSSQFGRVFKKHLRTSPSLWLRRRGIR